MLTWTRLLAQLPSLLPVGLTLLTCARYLLSLSCAEFAWESSKKEFSLGVCLRYSFFVPSAPIFDTRSSRDRIVYRFHVILNSTNGLLSSCNLKYSTTPFRRSVRRSVFPLPVWRRPHILLRGVRVAPIHLHQRIHESSSRPILLPDFC